MRKGNAMVFVKGSYSVPPDDTEFPVDPIIIKIRRYQVEIDRLNAPPVPATPEKAVGEAPTVKPPTKTARAKAWLADMLRDGPVPATTIEEAGLKAGFNLKMLKEAKKRLRIVSARKGRNHFVWQLPARAMPKEGQA
jgi:hypothetical protein